MAEGGDRSEPSYFNKVSGEAPPTIAEHKQSAQDFVKGCRSLFFNCADCVVLCLGPVKLPGVHVDLIDYGTISVLYQTYVDLGVVLNVGVREYFAVWPDYLDLVTNNEVDRLSRARIEGDCCPRRIIGNRS
jgi:hypothetical protein